jgi:hypothetical protein
LGAAARMMPKIDSLARNPRPEIVLVAAIGNRRDTYEEIKRLLR